MAQIAVQSLMVRLVQRIDPRTKAGAIIDSTNVGSVDGDKFTEQRRLDIYNDARFALFGALKTRYSNEELTRLIGSTVIDTTGTMASGQLAKPSDYVDFISFAKSDDTPVTMLPTSMLQDVLSGLNPHFTESATNLFLFDIGQNLVAFDASMATAAVKLRYYALPVYVLTDIDNTTTKESFDEKFHPLMIELGVAIANEQGQQEILALTQSLLGKQSQET